MKKRLLLTLSIIFSYLAVSSSFAAFPPPQGWYIEANGGYSSATNKSYDSSNIRRTGTGWNFNLGYKLTPFFSAEAGYTHYFPTRIYHDPKIEEDRHYSYDLAAKAILPITDSSAEFFGKLGMARVHSNTKIDNPSLATELNILGGTKNVTGLYMALGLEYYFAPSMAANIQWAKTHGNNETGDLNLYGMGLSYNFG